MNRIINFALLALLVFIVFSMSLTPLRSDNDAWWHLKTGKILFDRDFHLPKNDVFAYTSESVPWHNHEWLSQVLFYCFFRFNDSSDQAGVRWVIFLKGLVLLSAYLLVFGLCLRETKSVPLAVFVSLWAFLLARRTIYPRPPVFSYLFLAGYLFLLRETSTGRIGRRWLWILPPLMILWVNLHGGFILGLIVVAAYLFAEAVRGLRKKKSILDKTNLMNFSLLLSCFLCSLVNPYTYHLYFLPARVMGDIGLVRIIPELYSPDFFFTWSFEALIIFLIIAFSLIKTRIITLEEGLLLVFFMHQGLQHVRHLPLIGIVAAPVCARLLARLDDEYIPKEMKRLSPLIMSGLCLCLAFYTVFNRREGGESFLDRNRRYFKGIGFYESNYLVREADFIIANRFSGRMYNQINDAGYLIWRLSPEYHKVFTDSRYDIFGGRFMRQEQIIQNGIDIKRYPEDATWDELLEKWNVNFILISADAQVNPLLKESGKWKLVYHSLPPHADSSRAGFKIYVRDIPENKDLIARCLRSLPSMIPPAE